MSDIKPGIRGSNNSSHGKKYKQRINACSMASNKIVRLVFARRCGKRNRPIFSKACRK